MPTYRLADTVAMAAVLATLVGVQARTTGRLAIASNASMPASHTGSVAAATGQVGRIVVALLDVAVEDVAPREEGATFITCVTTIVICVIVVVPRQRRSALVRPGAYVASVHVDHRRRQRGDLGSGWEQVDGDSG